jgi:hypothetical protein
LRALRAGFLAPSSKIEKAAPRPAIIRHMGPYDDLSPRQLARIRRFVEEGDIDTKMVSDELRDLVEEHWPWLLAKLERQTLQ